MPSGIYKHKPRTEETKRKISKTTLKRKQRLGYINSPETRKKIGLANSIALKGLKFSKEHKKKMSLTHKGNKHSEMTKEKMRGLRPNISGKNNPHYGKPASHSKGAYYKGIWMRSPWEIRVAQLAGQAGIKWQYEPQRFCFKDCSYLPDFYLPKWNLWVEVKGWMHNEAKRRIELFRRYYPEKNLLIIDRFLYKKYCKAIDRWGLR